MAHLIDLSIYLSISFAKIGLKCTENRPQMYSSLIGSEASHDKINYLCLKCTESASNV